MNEQQKKQEENSCEARIQEISEHLKTVAQATEDDIQTLIPDGKLLEFFCRKNGIQWEVGIKIGKRNFNELP